MERATGVTASEAGWITKILYRALHKRLGRVPKSKTLAAHHTPTPVSYTHLDVYKRQALKQINAGNVSKLAQAWTYRLRPDATSPVAGTMSEVTPIVVNGVMYLPAGNRVLALDPETGAEIWRYELKTGAASQRGVAYWPGDKDLSLIHI